MVYIIYLYVQDILKTRCLWGICCVMLWDYYC